MKKPKIKKQIKYLNTSEIAERFKKDCEHKKYAKDL